MSIVRVTLASIVAATLLPAAASHALLQDGGGSGGAAGGQDGAPAGPRGPRGGRGGQPFDPETFIARMMEADANGDGKLSRDEMPPRIADRIFEMADADKDGFLERAELEVFVAEQPGGLGGRGQRGPDGGPGAGPGASAGVPANFDGAMRQAGRAMRALSRSPFDASSRAEDLSNLLSVSSALQVARADLDQVRMSPQASDRFGEDTDAFRAALRLELVRSSLEALQMEKAVLEGNGDAARTALMRLAETRDAAHALFQSDDEPAGERPRRRRGGEPGGAGEDGGGGAGGAGGAGRGGRGGAGGGGSGNDSF